MAWLGGRSDGANGTPKLRGRNRSTASHLLLAPVARLAGWRGVCSPAETRALGVYGRTASRQHRDTRYDY